MNPLSLILDLAPRIFDKLFPDPSVAADAKLKLIQLQQSGELAQMTSQTDINKIEAANPNIFVSGWRPFIGWTCGVAFAGQFVVGPFLTWVAGVAGHPMVFPTLDMDMLLTLLSGMLGLGGLRTFEKVKRVARH